MSDINPKIGLTVDESGFNKANELLVKLQKNIDSAVKKIQKLDNVKLQINATLSEQSIKSIKESITKAINEASSKISVSVKTDTPKKTTVSKEAEKTIKSATKSSVKKSEKNKKQEDYTGNFGRVYMGIDPTTGEGVYESIYKGAKSDTSAIKKKKKDEFDESERIRIMNTNVDLARQTGANEKKEKQRMAKEAEASEKERIRIMLINASLASQTSENEQREKKRMAKESQDYHDKNMKRQKAVVDIAGDTVNAFKFLTRTLFTVVGGLVGIGLAINKNAQQQSNALNQASSFNMSGSDYYNLQKTSQRYTGNSEAFNPLMSNLRKFQTDPFLTGDINSSMAIKFMTGLGMNISGKNGGLLKGDINTTVTSIVDQVLKNLNSKEYTQSDQKMKGMAEFVKELGGDDLWNAIKNLQALGQTSLKNAVREVSSNLIPVDQPKVQKFNLETLKTFTLFQNQMDTFVQNFSTALLPALIEFNTMISNNKSEISNGLKSFANSLVGLIMSLTGTFTGNETLMKKGNALLVWGQNYQRYADQGLINKDYSDKMYGTGMQKGISENEKNYLNLNPFAPLSEKAEVASSGMQALLDRFQKNVKPVGSGFTEQQRKKELDAIQRIVTENSGDLSQTAQELAKRVTGEAMFPGQESGKGNYNFNRDFVEQELRERAQSGKQGTGFGPNKLYSNKPGELGVQIGYDPANPWGNSGGGGTSIVQNINVYGNIASDVPQKLKDAIRDSIQRDNYKRQTISPSNSPMKMSYV